ncbi:hypothetical protein FB381_2977 [Nocardioides albertanoniae]|uniref:J domain-containing protein n=1 Tax=Nocardioides albertanoniae TaxID=1175486 RepID=A0A543A9D4_9ACTN|nr:hypothetical protein [Nocardioides albertanoniae]TQL69076.1 hypothetical protein FB381_2977 [Nocardioides albertanoniae]
MTFIDFYALLGIEQSADEQTIRAAVRKTRGRYRQQAGSPSLEQRSKAEQMLARIAEAEAAFESSGSRRAYDAELAAHQASAAPADRESEASAPQSRQRGAQKDWLKAAADYLDAGEARNAAGAAKEATHANPGDPRAWQLRARAALAQDDFRDAEFAATEAMKLMPGDAAGPGLRGDVLRAEGRHSEAEDAYRAAADLSSDDPTWDAQVAYTLIDQNRPKDAVVEARQMVVKHAGAQAARDALARVLIADSKAAMSNDQSGATYVASKRQVDHIESRLGEIEALAPLSDSVHRHRDGLRADLVAARSRRFMAPTGSLVLWVLGWVVIGIWLSWLILSLIFGDTLGILAAFVLNIGLAAALFLRVYPQQWQLNRKVLGDAWARTGL